MKEVACGVFLRLYQNHIEDQFSSIILGFTFSDIIWKKKTCHTKFNNGNWWNFVPEEMSQNWFFFYRASNCKQRNYVTIICCVINKSLDPTLHLNKLRCCVNYCLKLKILQSQNIKSSFSLHAHCEFKVSTKEKEQQMTDLNYIIS